MQLHPSDKEAVNRDEVIKILNQTGVVGLGAQWDGDGGQPKRFANDVKIGDIILIISNGPLALVEVISDCYENKGDNVWFDLVRKVKLISWDAYSYKERFKKIFKENWNADLFVSTTIQTANKSKFIKFWHQEMNEKKTN